MKRATTNWNAECPVRSNQLMNRVCYSDKKDNTWTLRKWRTYPALRSFSRKQTHPYANETRKKKRNVLVTVRQQTATVNQCLYNRKIIMEWLMNLTNHTPKKRLMSISVEDPAKCNFFLANRWLSKFLYTFAETFDH